MTNEFILFSDIHLHEFAENAKTITTIYNQGTLINVNSRLYHGILVLNQIFSYALEHNIKDIVFAGDLFHSKRNTTKTVYNMLLDALSRYKAVHMIRWHFLCGNHDMVSADGIDNSLGALRHRNGIHVYDNSLPNNPFEDFTFIPYSDNKEDVKRQLAEATGKYIIMHAGIQGARVGADYVMTKESDLSIEDLNAKDKWIFLGHFHEHQKLAPRVYYIGATHHHNWGDANTRRGFLHFKNDNFTFVDTCPEVPRFVRVKAGEDMSHIRPHDFVEVITTEKDFNPEDYKSLNNVKPKFVEAKESEDASIDLTQLNSDESILDGWLRTKGKEGDEYERLKALGIELLNE